ncbi:MAG: hypothetical protein U1A27_05385 [Phycisphaerae bacterium]
MPGRRADAGSSPWGQRIVFFLLLILASVLYAPAVLLPVLRDHARVLAEEQALQHDVTALEEQVQRAERLAEAFRTDPAVNERLAQLELRYERPGERVVTILPDEPGAAAAHPASAAESESLVPADWPDWARTAETAAARWGLVRLFLAPATRGVLLLMSAGLLIAAFVLFPPVAPRSRAAAGEAAPTRV